MYAPLRKKYINKCPFCEEDGSLDVFHFDFWTLRVNKFPYCVGHLLLFPKRHVLGFSGLNSQEIRELSEILPKVEELAKTCYGTNSLNIGMNIGPHSGASLEHLHIHFLPRFKGDVGFVETIANEKVFTETVEEMVEKYRSKIKEVIS